MGRNMATQKKKKRKECDQIFWKGKFLEGFSYRTRIVKQLMNGEKK